MLYIWSIKFNTMDITFSKSEQVKIREIIKANNVDTAHLSTFLYDNKKYIAVEWDADYMQVYIYLNNRDICFDEQEEHTNNKVLYDAYNSLCETLFLFKKLECNDLIGLYRITEILKNKERALFDRTKYKRSKIGQYYSIESQSGKLDIIADIATRVPIYVDMGKDLEKYTSGIFFISQTLKELVKDNFKSKEQKRHRNTMIAAWVAIALSILMGLVGLFQQPSDKITTPLNSINKNISDISLKVDSIKSNTIKLNKDSLNTIP